jgi:light-regulated signal transduction histidine kinase (bacteriophytochrome)
MPLTAIDLLEQLRAALDELEPLLGGRIVDIEMSRVRVLADPQLFLREFALLIASAVADAEPTDSITVRLARTGAAVRIEVVNERVGARLDGATGPMTLPLAPGASSAADA